MDGKSPAGERSGAPILLFVTSRRGENRIAPTLPCAETDTVKVDMDVYLTIYRFDRCPVLWIGELINYHHYLAFTQPR